MATRAGNWARAAAVISFALLGALLYVRYNQAVQLFQTRTAAQTLGGLAASVLSEAKDVETSARAFVLTGDHTYLAPFARAASAIPPQVARMEALAPADVSEKQSIDQFAAFARNELDVSNRIVTLRRTGRTRAASGLTATARQAMDHLRTATTGLTTGARARITLDRAASQRGSQVVRNLMEFLFFFAIAMMCVAGFQIRRELRRRTKAEEALREAYEYMETRITARTQELVGANTRLESSERRLRLIAELGLVHLFTMRPDGSAEYVTAGFPALTGLPGDQILGSGWLDAMHPGDRQPFLDSWRQGVDAGGQFDVEFRLLTATGAPRGFKMRVLPVADGEGQATQLFGAAIDMHEQQEGAALRAEALTREQAARAEAELANRLKDDFLATVSHELRTPLHAIVGWVHILQQGIGGDRARAIDAIQRNALVQARLIDDLLDVSRMLQGRFTLLAQPLDLRSAIRAALVTVNPAATAKGVDVRLSLGEEVKVFGDEARLQQVAWNLLSNAVKFTRKGGRITVKVARIGSQATFKIADDGEGIDPGFLPHVFEPFRQGASRSMRSGLGLGLAIVRQIVELHGGTIVAESPGRDLGASFVVSLPLGDASIAPAMAANSLDAYGQAGLRILIAEDDEDSAIILKTILRHRGCEVRTAVTAQECLAAFDEWPPDLLLCDVGLPDDDGYSLLRRLRERTTHEPVPAIALTAFAREEDRVRALAAGFAAHVSKPLDPARLLEEITRAVTPRTH